MPKSPLIKTVVINQSLATSNSFTFNAANDIGFDAKYMIIRQLIYSNIAGTDSGTYLIRSSLSGHYIGAAYVGIQSNTSSPNSVISFNGIIPPSITFTLEPANAAYTGPTGELVMVLEFTNELYII
jgi:hypothetical protein